MANNMNTIPAEVVLHTKHHVSLQAVHPAFAGLVLLCLLCESWGRQAGKKQLAELGLARSSRASRAMMVVLYAFMPGGEALRPTPLSSSR